MKFNPHARFPELLFIVLCFLIWQCRPKAPVPEDLFAQFFSVDIPTGKLPTPGVASSTLESQAFRLLAEANYQQAAILFREVAIQEKNSAYMLYRGMAQLADQEPEAAARSLKQVLPQANNYQKAQWYLALSALANDGPATARQILTNMNPSALPNMYQKKHQELLDLLSI